MAPELRPCRQRWAASSGLRTSFRLASPHRGGGDQAGRAAELGEAKRLLQGGRARCRGQPARARVDLHHARPHRLGRSVGGHGRQSPCAGRRPDRGRCGGRRDRLLSALPNPPSRITAPRCSDRGVGASPWSGRGAPGPGHRSRADSRVQRNLRGARRPGPGTASGTPAAGGSSGGLARCARRGHARG